MKNCESISVVLDALERKASALEGQAREELDEGLAGEAYGIRFAVEEIRKGVAHEADQ